MEWSTVFGIVARQGLASAAGWFMSHGMLAADGSGNEAFIGAGMLFLTMGWSAWQKYGKVLVDKHKADASTLHPDAIKAP